MQVAATCPVVLMPIDLTLLASLHLDGCVSQLVAGPHKRWLARPVVRSSARQAPCCVPSNQLDYWNAVAQADPRPPRAQLKNDGGNPSWPRPPVFPLERRRQSVDRLGLGLA